MHSLPNPITKPTTRPHPHNLIKTMHYLFNKWKSLLGDLKNKSLFFFLDYDGTLTPIRESPKKAVMSRETKAVLRRLSKDARYKVAIISGRSLKDIKKVVGISGIEYVGNHGLEIEGPKIKFKCPVSPAYTDLLRKIKKALAERFSGIKGVLVEDKGLTLSVHFRQVKKADEILVKDIFHSVMRPYLERKDVRTTFGKKVFEVRPPFGWDKGKAVLWLLAHSTALRASPEQAKRVEGLARRRFRMKDNIMPIYIGDDVTDEDAFKALKKRGITIFVGNAPLSKAKYYLEDSEEVVRFLKMIASKDKKDAGIIKSERTL